MESKLQHYRMISTRDYIRLRIYYLLTQLDSELTLDTNSSLIYSLARRISKLCEIFKTLPTNGEPDGNEFFTTEG